MKKLTFKPFFILLGFFVVLNSTLFSQETIHTEDSGTVRIFTLANGFPVFVKEDRTSALVRIEFMVKAGFSAQSPSDAGFFPLYTRLFLNTASSDKTLTADLSAVTSSCNADSATFIVTASQTTVEAYLSSFARCVLHPQFSDAQLQTEYIKMKQEVSDYKSSTTGFINSAIDSRVFSQFPWKQDSGIYPALFRNYSLAEVRTIMNSIGRNFYTPDNSALFISGNISPEEAYRLVEKYYSEWNGFASVTAASSLTMNSVFTEAADKQGIQAQRKFVLVDNSFSKELTQIIVQYTTLLQSQADILAASFTSAQSPYKSTILAEPALAVRSKEYLTAASAQKNGSSRFILQALMEAPYSFSQNTSADGQVPDISEQADLFVSTAAKAAHLSRTNFIYAQNLIASKYRSETGSSSESMGLLADYWALDSAPGSHKGISDFYTRFLNVVYAVQTQTESNIATAVDSEQPYIFVLVNSDVFNKQKDSFKAHGFVSITTGNASWYQDEIVRAKIYDTEQQTLMHQSDLSEITDISIATPKQSFYTTNKDLLSSATLSNAIPIIVKRNPQSQTALISIAIAGGEHSSPKDERFLRTVLINAFTRNIQIEINRLRQQNTFIGETNLSAWTEETSSYITISCMADDIDQSLKATANAILYGEVAPIIADSLVAEQKNQWLIKSSNLLYQMTCSSLNTLYSGTSFEKLFDADSSILQNTKYNSIPLEYTKLLDASLYSIVIAGNVSQTEAVSYAEETFGLLHQQTKRNSITIETPSFTKTTRRMLLRHTFTTDIPAEQAGERPEVLVPTKDFYDPVQFWFEPPEDISYHSIFNALLYELQSRVQAECGKDIICSVQPATPVIHAGCIQGEHILHTAAFLSAYKKALKSLTTDLQKDDGTLIASIASRWIIITLDKTQSNDGTAILIQKGLLAGMPSLYLEDYATLTTADKTTYYDFIKKYFPEDPVFKIYSADSKR
jgi:zinc protease